MLLVQLCLICSLLVEQVSKMSVRIKKLEDDLSVAKQKCQEAEQEVSGRSSFCKTLSQFAVLQGCYCSCRD